jgi:hypothetical protein
VSKVAVGLVVMKGFGVMAGTVEVALVVVICVLQQVTRMDSNRVYPIFIDPLDDLLKTSLD